MNDLEYHRHIRLLKGEITNLKQRLAQAIETGTGYEIEVIRLRASNGRKDGEIQILEREILVMKADRIDMVERLTRYPA